MTSKRTYPVPVAVQQASVAAGGLTASGLALDLARGVPLGVRDLQAIRLSFQVGTPDVDLLGGPDSQSWADRILERLENLERDNQQAVLASVGYREGSGHAYYGLVDAEGSSDHGDAVVALLKFDPLTEQVDRWTGTEWEPVPPEMEPVGQPYVLVDGPELLADLASSLTSGAGLLLCPVSPRGWVPGGVVASSAGASHESLWAAVDDLDPAAVLDLFRVVQGKVFVRQDGEWVPSLELASRLRGVKPPRAVRVPQESAARVLRDVDAHDAANKEKKTVSEAKEGTSEATKDPVQASGRVWTSEQREAASRAGQALPDGSFPIANRADLRRAVLAYGRAKDKTAAKEHIIRRAKALGGESMLPDEWGITAAAGVPTTRMPENLRKYWTTGKGALKIRWGTSGDWTRCSRYLSKYMSPYAAKGACNTLHRLQTGMWTGSKAHKAVSASVEPVDPRVVAVTAALVAALPTFDEDKHERSSTGQFASKGGNTVAAKQKQAAERKAALQRAAREKAKFEAKYGKVAYAAKVKRDQAVSKAKADLAEQVKWRGQQDLILATYRIERERLMSAKYDLNGDGVADTGIPADVLSALEDRTRAALELAKNREKDANTRAKDSYRDARKSETELDREMKSGAKLMAPPRTRSSRSSGSSRKSSTKKSKKTTIPDGFFKSMFAYDEERVKRQNAAKRKKR